MSLFSEHKPHLTAGAYYSKGLYRDTVCMREFPDTPEGLAAANAKADELLTRYAGSRYLIEVERWEPFGTAGCRGTTLRSTFTTSATGTDR